MYRFVQCFVLLSLLGIGLAEKSIKWGSPYPCILINIDATNSLEWVDSDDKITVAANFTFDDMDVTEGSCGVPNPYVGGIWDDGKHFEMVFYNDAGITNVQMNIFFNPAQVFKHNLTDHVRNIVNFDAGPFGKAYSCNTSTSHEVKTHVGKEAYRYTFQISTIQIQGYNVTGGRFSDMVECPQDMTSSTHSTQSTSIHPTNHTTHSTKPSTHSTKPSTHSTKPSTHSTKPSTHSTKPSTHTTKPSTHSTHPTNLTTHSTKPTTHSTKPSTHSTHSTTPSNHSTHPSSHSTHPSTHPTPPTSPPLPVDHVTPKKQDFTNGCMRMVGKFQFTLSYPTNTTGQNQTASFGVNDIKAVTGQCGKPSDNVLQVTFYNNWQMNITVKSGNSIVDNLGGDANNMYAWSQISLMYYYNEMSQDKTPWFPNVNKTYVNRTMVISKTLPKDTFQGNINGSYACDSQTTLDLGDGNSFNTWDLQYIAFQTSPNITFPSNDVTNCPTPSKSHAYIYVGIVLGVVVILVMVVYIAGRCCYRKSYEEM